MRPLLLLASVVLLAGCSSGGGDGGPEHHPAGQTITIDGFSYSPASITVKQGDTVYVVNKHTATHTLTLDSGERDTGQLAPGKEAQFTMPTPGRHDYHCEVHSTMTGIINVVAA